MYLSQVLDGATWSTGLEREGRAHLAYTRCLRRQSLHMRLGFTQHTVPLSDHGPKATRKQWHCWEVTNQWSAVGFLTCPWEALFKPEPEEVLKVSLGLLWFEAPLWPVGPADLAPLMQMVMTAITNTVRRKSPSWACHGHQKIKSSNP